MANAGYHPKMATFPPGRPEFGYSTPKRYPLIIPHYPKMAGLFNHIGPTAQHAPSEFHPSLFPLLPTKTHKNRRLAVHDLLLPATNHRVLSPSLPLSNQKSHTSAQRSLSPSNQKPPQHSSSIQRHIMSDATTLLSQKCYPDTKSMRGAVAQMRHQRRISSF